jgi:hypothetical protein
MTARTLAEARQVLENEVLPAVSDYWAPKLKAAMDEAEQDARNRASQFVDEREAEGMESRKAALEELTSVRDAMDDLRPQIEAGRISAADAAKAVRELHDRQDAAEGALARVGSLAETMAGIEDDPIAWWSGQQERLPALRWDAPW